MYNLAVVASGEGGTFVIVNMTPYSWTRTLQQDYQMNTWSFPATFPSGMDTVLPVTPTHANFIYTGSVQNLYVEWDTSFLTDEEDDGGEVVRKKPKK